MSGPRGRYARFGRVQRKPDANHAAIHTALRQCGATIVDLQGVGNGCPDLLVGYRGVNRLLEIKTADGAVQDNQHAFAETWRGDHVLTVRSVAEALQAIGINLTS